MPPALLVQKKRKKAWNLTISSLFGGDKRDRTADLLNAIQVRNQKLQKHQKLCMEFLLLPQDLVFSRSFISNYFILVQHIFNTGRPVTLAQKFVSGLSGRWYKFKNAAAAMASTLFHGNYTVILKMEFPKLRRKNTVSSKNRFHSFKSKMPSFWTWTTLPKCFKTPSFQKINRH